MATEKTVELKIKATRKNHVCRPGFAFGIASFVETAKTSPLPEVSGVDPRTAFMNAFGESRWQALRDGLSIGCHAAHGASFAAGWYHDPNTGALREVNVGEKLMLIVSEVSEAMEAHRKDKMDDHLPHRPGAEVELADAIIRIFDLRGCMGLDLAGAVVEKMEYNARRADHSKTARASSDGKAY